MTLTLEHRPDGWWVTGLPESDPDCGPYDTRQEATDDYRGLKRFYRYGHQRSFITSEREPKP